MSVRFLVVVIASVLGLAGIELVFCIVSESAVFYICDQYNGDNTVMFLLLLNIVLYSDRLSLFLPVPPSK